MNRIILSATALIISAFTLYGQESASSKKVFMGFNIGLNYTNINTSSNNLDLFVKNSAGFSMGILGGYQFSKNFSISANSGISFHQNELYAFNYFSGVFLSYSILPTTLDFGLQTSYQLQTKSNKSPYILLGPSIQVPISKPVLSTEFGSSTNLAVELGLGCNIKFSDFILAPEIRYSYGINNVNTNPALHYIYFHSVKLLMSFRSV